MWTAIIIIFIVMVFLVGGWMVLLKHKDFKIPDDYDASKSGFADEDDDSSY